MYSGDLMYSAVRWAPVLMATRDLQTAFLGHWLGAMNDSECIGGVSVMCRPILGTRDFIEYFRGSLQELNHHLVSARRSCRS